MRSPSIQLLRAFRVGGFDPFSACSAQRVAQKYPTARAAHHFTFTPKAQRPLRSFSSAVLCRLPQTSKSSDRGPRSKEDTQTDFGSMNVLGNTPAPTTAIDACLSDGFHFDSGLKIGGGSGCLLVGGEAFSWRPWEAGSRRGGPGTGRMANKKGQWDVEKEAWGIFDLVWPKPGKLCFLSTPLVHGIASTPSKMKC